MDGSNRKILLNSSQPIGSLKVDLESKRLYFIRKGTGGIDYLDLRFGNVHEVVHPEKILISYHQVDGLAIYKDTIYFADNTDGKIDKCDKTTCANRTTVRTNKDKVYSLAVFHSGAQQSKNPLANSTKKCDHLRLATSSTGYVCKCAIGYSVDPNDSSKCVGEREFLLYSIGHELRGVRLNEKQTQDDQMEHVLAPIPRVSFATKIDYHHRNDLLFYADTDKGEITRIKRDGTNRQVIVNQTDLFDANGGDWLSGMAVDWIAENIYWCDEKRNIIEVARLNGSLRYVVISYANKPKAIAVDPIAGYLFYVGGDKKGEYRLEIDANKQTTKQIKSINIKFTVVVPFAGSYLQVCILHVGGCS